jgi:ribonuclease HIII
MTITVIVSDKVKDEMADFFKDLKRAKTPAYAVFQADDADTVVTLYESGKAVFQGVSADISANLWIERERHLNPLKKVETTNSEDKKTVSENSNLMYLNTIGSDEVGTGDYFGPIVVAACYTKKEDINFLKEIGVKDSKALTDEQILKIVPQFIKKIPYESLILSNAELNQKYNKDMNMNKMKAVLHNKVLASLSSRYNDYDKIIVDQFAPATIYFSYLKGASYVVRNITFETKAESKCMSVACASLICRYIFLKEYEKLEKRLGIVLPKGAGENVDLVGKEILSKFGSEEFNKLVKLNFKNTEKIKNL